MPSITKVTVNVGPSTPPMDDLAIDDIRPVDFIEITFNAAVSDTSDIFPLTVNVPNGNQIQMASGTATLVANTTATYKILYSGNTTEPDSLPIGPDGTATVIAGSVDTNDSTNINIAE